MSAEKQIDNLEMARVPSVRRGLVYGFFGVVAIYAALMALQFIVSIPKVVGQSSEKRAQEDIRMLELAIQTFAMKYDRLPDNLRSLTVQLEGDSKPMLVEKQLIDPWGQPYNYNPKRLDPISNRPLVWSAGPPGGNTPFSNWTPVGGFPGR